VDEAHATGVFGPRGAGVVQQLGVEDRIFIRMHTFGKALASHGGMIEAPSPENRINWSFSNCTMLLRYQRLPHQLRPQLDLHYCLRISLSCFHSQCL
jgi:7-keto-8-aminopelargonate synthetase-like enzyme